MRHPNQSLAIRSVAIISILFGAACAIDAPSAPRTGQGALASRSHDLPLPGSTRTFTASGVQPLNCAPKDPSYGSARIGPSGGDLIIGRHRLIVPPGALTTTVEISGTVPDDKPFEIDLQPHGLHFKKAAGLILDASNCTDVPNIVYLIDQFTVSAPILATYSNWWHTIACPIWHFSGYSVYFNTGSDDGSEALTR